MLYSNSNSNSHSIKWYTSTLFYSFFTEACKWDSALLQQTKTISLHDVLHWSLSTRRESCTHTPSQGSKCKTIAFRSRSLMVQTFAENQILSRRSCGRYRLRKRLSLTRIEVNSTRKDEKSINHTAFSLHLLSPELQLVAQTTSDNTKEDVQPHTKLHQTTSRQQIEARRQE